jgi:hypothetical protein
MGVGIYPDCFWINVNTHPLGGPKGHTIEMLLVSRPVPRYTQFHTLIKYPVVIG